MQAVWYTLNGEAKDVLQFGEMPTPQPQSGEVLVRLMTSGVNPSDVKSRRARPLSDPIIPHSDGAGVIESVGSDVSSSRIGERVWIWNGQWQRPHGTAAQFIALPAEQAVPLHKSVDFAQASCLGIPTLTAIQAVNLAGDLQNQTVLVTGAASAVGHYVTQLIKLAGGHVIGTVGTEERAVHAKKAGADEIIFYKTQSVSEKVLALTHGKGVETIIDLDFSGTIPLINEGCLSKHGQVIVYGSNTQKVNVTTRPMTYGSVQLKFFLVYDLKPMDRKNALDRMQHLLQTQQLIHSVGPRFRLNQVVLAHEMVESGKAIGNVVIDIS